MTRKYFGTDGIRGRVGVAPITPEFVMRLGYAAGRVLTHSGHSISSSPAVLIGKDTRISGYMLESALQAGLSAAGVDSHLTGPIPTPAVAYLTRALRLQAGIVISASHNPYDDNGIKFFSAAGEKLDDGIECAIEAGLNDLVRTVASEKLGKAYRIKDAAGRYIEFCKSAFPNELDLRGMRIVVDCAHGATYHVAPHVFHELGAEVVSIGVQPDGLNINAGFGATETDALKQAVLREHADIGIALDGDGDRVMMIDASGALFDGDQLLFLMARHRQQEGRLKGGVVGTAMTNLGVEQAFRQLNIPFARAKVGDRYVLEMLKARGWQLGGEGSGHIICLAHALPANPYQCEIRAAFQCRCRSGSQSQGRGSRVGNGQSRPRAVARFRHRARGTGYGGGRKARCRRAMGAGNCQAGAGCREGGAPQRGWRWRTGAQSSHHTVTIRS